MIELPCSTAWEPLALPGAWESQVRSAGDGRAWRLLVHQPDGPPPAAGFPVCYLLDGGDLFVSVAEVLRRAGRRSESTGIGPALLVGVGHAPAQGQRERARRDDYTLGPSVDGQPSTGQAAALLRFLCDELAPRVEADVPINRSRRGLFGHSMAGYFCLHALLSRPQAFSHVAAVSPSIWWDSEALWRCVDAGGLAAAVPGLYLAAGQWEGEPAPWQRRLAADPAGLERRRQRRMLAHARGFAERLGGHLPADSVCFEELPGEDHASVLGPAIPRALRFMQG